MIKSNFLLCAAVLGLAVSQAGATLISFTGGSSSTSGTLGNTRIFNAGPNQVTASAQWSVTGGDPWLNTAYLGWYSNGLGVTHSGESTSSPAHTVDNLNGYDRIVFDFLSSVELDEVGLRQYGDTDISVYYYSGSAWSLLETNNGGSVNRTANVNNATVRTSATKWAIGTGSPLDNYDYFKVSSIKFNAPVSAPPVMVPDAGGSLLLLAIGMGVLVRLQRQIAAC